MSQLLHRQTQTVCTLSTWWR